MLIGSLGCLKEEANGHDTCFVYISKWVSLISVTYVVGKH